MKNKLLKYILAVMVCIFGTTTLFSVPTFATDPCDNSLPETVLEANGCNNDTKNKLPNIITNILYAVIGVSGLVAVIFIIMGGIQYMTSTGDSAKTQKAKNTILYAIIGLIVCVLSFAIVNWTIGRLAESEKTAPSEEKTQEDSKKVK